MNVLDAELGRFGLDARSPIFALRFPSMQWPEARDFARSNSTLTLGRLAQVLAGAHSFLTTGLTPDDKSIAMRTSTSDRQEAADHISAAISVLFVVCPKLTDINLEPSEISTEQYGFNPSNDFNYIPDVDGNPTLAYLHDSNPYEQIGEIFAKMLSLTGYEYLLMNMVGLFKFIDEGGDAADAQIGLSAEAYELKDSLTRKVGTGTLALTLFGPDFSGNKPPHQVDPRLPLQLDYISKHISKRRLRTI